MQYYKKDLWMDMQDKNTYDEARHKWDINMKEYMKIFKKIKKNLNPSVYEFFTAAKVHDGYITTININNLKKNATKKNSKSKFPIDVNLKVVDCDESYCYTLKYSKVSKIIIDCPSAEPFFYFDYDGFGEWSYSELISVRKGFYQHNILFSSGAEINIEFKDMDVKKHEILK